MNLAEPCKYFQIDMLDNCYLKCKNCGNQKADHEMYKSHSIIAEKGRNTLLNNVLKTYQEESKETGKKIEQLTKPLSEKDKHEESDKDSDKEDINLPLQRSSVHRVSLGSVKDIASKFGGQTNAVQTNRRATEYLYKVE